MKIWIALFMLIGGVCMAEDSFIVTDDHRIHYDPAENWVVSKELIARLGLSSEERLNNSYSLIIIGEDGKQYDWAYVLKKHMDWTEAHYWQTRPSRKANL